MSLWRARLGGPHNLPSGAWLEMTRDSMPMYSVDAAGPVAIVSQLPEYWVRDLPLTDGKQIEQLGKTFTRQCSIRATGWTDGYLADVQLTVEEASRVANGADIYLILFAAEPLRVVWKPDAAGL